MSDTTYYRATANLAPFEGYPHGINRGDLVEGAGGAEFDGLVAGGLLEPQSQEDLAPEMERLEGELGAVLPRVAADDYTKEELVTLAEQRGVDVSESMTKAQLVDAINAAAGS